MEYILAIIIIINFIVLSQLKKSAVKLNNYKIYLVLTPVVLFVIYYIFKIYGSINLDKVLLWIVIFTIGILIFLGINLINKINGTNKFYQMIIAHTNTEDTCFLVLDKKDKIKLIGKELLADLNITADECLNENYLELFTKHLDFVCINGKNVDNYGLKKQYKVEKITAKTEIEYSYKTENKAERHIKMTIYPIVKGRFYCGKILIGKYVNAFNNFNKYDDQQVLKNDFKVLQSKFKAIIEITDEGMFFFKQNDNQIFATDKYKKIFNLESNSETRENIQKLIYEKDLEHCLNMKRKVFAKGSYTHTYRIKRNGQLIWILEKAKLLNFNGELEVVGVVKEVTNRVEKKSVQMLDDVDYKLEINNLLRNGQHFWVLRINLDHLKDIALELGKEIKNHLLIEILKKYKKEFISEKVSLYQVDTLELALIVRDIDKIELIKKNFLRDDDMFYVRIRMSALTITVRPFIGIAKIPGDAKELEDVLNVSETALKMAKKQVVKARFCYYEEIKDVF